MVASATDERSIADLVEAEIARRQFGGFCRRLDPLYQARAHSDLLIDHLEQLERREFRRLMVFMPPQVGKSYHVAQRFPAWYLGRNPRHGVAVASYAAALAEAHSRVARSLFAEPGWPFEVGIAEESRAVDRWETSEGGGLRAVGVGGGLTGFGTQLGVIDDPVKDREEAESQNQRDKVWDWYQDVVRTRWRAQSLQLIMLTRWHEDDLAGRILNSPGASQWRVLSVPAIAEEGDALGRQPGEGLCPVGYTSPEEYLANLPSVELGEISSRSRAALYQQRPTSPEGSTFRAEWMTRRWTSLPTEAPPDDPDWRAPARWIVIQTLDTSWDKGVGHDFSVIATWATDGEDFYLLNVWRQRVEYPDLRAAAYREFEAHRPRGVFVEDKANGRVLVQELRRPRPGKPGLPVIPTLPQGSKESRADAATAAFESGRVVLPANAPWLQEWLDEHLAFPTGAHDDQVDTTSEAIKQLEQLSGSRRRSREIEVRAGDDPLADRTEISARRREALQKVQQASRFPRVRA